MVDDLLIDAESHIASIVQLGPIEPPIGWRSELAPIGWEALEVGEQELLVAALTAAHEWLEDVTIWLFGSRAVGTSRDGSDFDLLIVVPDAVQVGLQGMIRGAVSTVFRRLGIPVDHYLATKSGFAEPDAGSALLYEKVKRLGFPLPWPVPANAD